MPSDHTRSKQDIENEKLRVISALDSNAILEDVEPTNGYFDASYVGRFLWTFARSILQRGKERMLDINDFHRTSHNDVAEPLLHKLEVAWESEVDRVKRKNEKTVRSAIEKYHKNKPAEDVVQSDETVIGNQSIEVEIESASFLRAAFNAFGGIFFMVGLTLLFYTGTKIGTVLLLRELLIFIRYDGTPMSQYEDWQGYMFVLGIGLLSIAQTTVHHQYFYHTCRIGHQLKASAMALIYKKSLKLSSASLAQTSTGQAINVISNDPNRFELLAPFLNFTWGAPMETGICLYLVYREIGISFIFGAAVLISMLFFQFFSSFRFGDLRTHIVKHTDARVKAVNEILVGTEIVKMYSWEEPLEARVRREREDELTYIKKNINLKGINMATFFAASTLINLVTFVGHIARGGVLTSDNVFTVMGYYGLITFPFVQYLPWAIEMTTECSIASKRIQKFLLLGRDVSGYGVDVEETDVNTHSHHDHSNSHADSDKSMPAGVEMASLSTPVDGPLVGSITVNDASFEWPQQSGDGSLFGKLNYVLGHQDILDYTHKHNNTNNANATAAMTPEIVAPASSSITAITTTATSTTSTGLGLHHINLSVRPGELVAVVGTVGAYKSSLLQALLGEMPYKHPTDTTVTQMNTPSFIAGTVAYAPQRPWLMAASIRDNIVFGSVYDEHRYARTLWACGLLRDITLFPAGDATIVSENGKNLSGGQKARIALARACYADVDVYLFDDVLAAVDQIVAKHIFVNCISNKGILKDKTRVVVTHQSHFLPSVDTVVAMNKGRVMATGRYAVLERKGVFSQTTPYMAGKTPHHGARSGMLAGTPATKTTTATTTTAMPDLQLNNNTNNSGSSDLGDEECRLAGRMCAAEPTLGFLDHLSPVSSASHQHSTGTGITTTTTTTTVGAVEGVCDDLGEQDTVTVDPIELDLPSDATPTAENVLLNEEEQAQSAVLSQPFDLDTVLALVNNPHNKAKAKAQTVLSVEDKSEGGISFAVYKDFFVGKSMAYFLFVCVCLVSPAALRVASDQWMSDWSSLDAFTQTDVYYRDVYIGLCVATIVVALIRAILCMRHILTSSSHAHNHMVTGVVYSPLSFFQSNPIGRILNRFSKDQSTLDETMPTTLYDFLQVTINVISSLVVVGMVAPYILLSMLVVIPLFVYLRQLYIITSREVKRLDATSRSPIFTLFSSSLTGLAIIRAYGMQTSFKSLFLHLLDTNTRAFMAYHCTSRWLGVRLDAICVCLTLGTGFFCVGMRDTLGASNAGFVLVYLNNMTTVFQWMTRQSAEVENEMTSAERIMTYGKLPSEGVRYGDTELPTTTTTTATVPTTPTAEVEEVLRRVDELNQSITVMQQQRQQQEKEEKERRHGIVIVDEKTNDEEGEGDVETQKLSKAEQDEKMADLITQLWSFQHKNNNNNNDNDNTTPTPTPTITYRPPESWPQHGGIDVRHLVMGYRPGLPAVLRNLNFTIQPGQKVGICGRTGAGKSSLFGVLFRLFQAYHGQVLIDGVDIATIGLHDLRSKMAIIPQSPVIFSGTIRYNLDPFNNYSDEAIMTALTKVHLRGLVDSLPHGLNTLMSEQGGNLSSGEAQLMCIARALLMPSKLLFVDEATANVDPHTDTLVQRLLRSEFTDRTVMTIAHRLHTIMYCDVILVLDAGVVVEQGTPASLLASNGVFASMYAAQQEDQH